MNEPERSEGPNVMLVAIVVLLVIGLVAFDAMALVNQGGMDGGQPTPTSEPGLPLTPVPMLQGLLPAGIVMGGRAAFD